MSITYTTVRPSEYYDDERYSDEESQGEESEEEEEEGPYLPQPVRYRSMQSKMPPQFMQHHKEHHHHNRGEEEEEEEGRGHRYARASYDFPYRSTGCSAPVLGSVEVDDEDDEDSDDE